MECVGSEMNKRTQMVRYVDFATSTSRARWVPVSLAKEPWDADNEENRAAWVEWSVAQKKRRDRSCTTHRRQVQADDLGTTANSRPKENA